MSCVSVVIMVLGELVIMPYLNHWFDIQGLVDIERGTRNSSG